jgi:cell pole-organizing protein PopZ
MAGHSVATHSAQQQQHEADQDAQLAEMQQQAAYPPQQASAPPPQYATAPAPVENAPAQDPIEMLQRLGELKAAGVLTEEEFQAKKAELLKQI